MAGTPSFSQPPTRSHRLRNQQFPKASCGKGFPISAIDRHSAERAKTNDEISYPVGPWGTPPVSAFLVTAPHRDVGGAAKLPKFCGAAERGQTVGRAEKRDVFLPNANESFPPPKEFLSRLAFLRSSRIKPHPCVSCPARPRVHESSPKRLGKK